MKFDAHFLERLKLSEPLLYKALASKFGLLSSDLIFAITEFHGNFENARTWLPLLMENPEKEIPLQHAGSSDTGAGCGKKCCSRAANDRTDGARRKRGERAGLGCIEDVIELEEEGFKTPTDDAKRRGRAGRETGEGG